MLVLKYSLRGSLIVGVRKGPNNIYNNLVFDLEIESIRPPREEAVLSFSTIYKSIGAVVSEENNLTTSFKQRRIKSF